MADQEDEIQLVHRTGDRGDSEEDADPSASREDSFEVDDTPCLTINYSDKEGSEPRVEDERHIKHPGKLKMRLRVRYKTSVSCTPSLPHPLLSIPHCVSLFSSLHPSIHLLFPLPICLSSLSPSLHLLSPPFLPPSTSSLPFRGYARPVPSAGAGG